MSAGWSSSRATASIGRAIPCASPPTPLWKRLSVARHSVLLDGKRARGLDDSAQDDRHSARDAPQHPAVPIALGRDALGIAAGIQVWNDWTGACKVYGACVANLVCVSTLEPVVYRTIEPGRDGVAPAAVYALMTTGHFFGDQTLYESIRVQPPDTVACYASGSRRVARCGTIRPSDERWAMGWDELVDEWSTVLEDAIGGGLGEPRPLTLMLSGVTAPCSAA